MNIFDSVLVKKPERSLFNLSHECKLTGNMGYLYPILCQEVLPGDTWKINSEILVRFAPLVAPIMHRVNVKINYFFVPNRLIWQEWEDFITGGEEGDKFPVKPFIQFPASQSSKIAAGTLADYLGFPTPTTNNAIPADSYVRFDALPFRAYNLIWNEYYRNQNLQTKKTISVASGQDMLTPTSLLKRCWEKDYFTSALPFALRGAENVKLPIDSGDVTISGSGQAAVIVDTLSAGYNDDLEVIQQPMKMQGSGGTQRFVAASDPSNINSGDDATLLGTVQRGAIASGLSGSLDGVDATIQDLRTAYRLQRWLENNARAGSRYIEQILSHFGVKSSDARLQRPEYLGGYSAPIVISEVLQNSASDASSTPQGNMAGHAMALDRSHKVKKFFEEHGFIIGLLSVIPRTNYQEGLPRQYQRSTRYDYYWPEFANLGEQEVRNNEVYFNFAAQSGDSTRFGYQQRFCEYRYIPSSVHGEFKTNLSFWHLGRIFDTSIPALNSDFVTCSPRSDIFAVEDEEAADKLWIEVYNNVRAVRPLPKFAIPTL